MNCDVLNSNNSTVIKLGTCILYMYIYIHIYMYIHMCVYIYIWIYTYIYKAVVRRILHN